MFIPRLVAERLKNLVVFLTVTLEDLLSKSESNILLTNKVKPRKLCLSFGS